LDKAHWLRMENSKKYHPQWRSPPRFYSYLSLSACETCGKKPRFNNFNYADRAYGHQIPRFFVALCASHPTCFNTSPALWRPTSFPTHPAVG
jgi:hypothetical protein